jgi:hypothetical protein
MGSFFTKAKTIFDFRSSSSPPPPYSSAWTAEDRAESAFTAENGAEYSGNAAAAAAPKELATSTPQWAWTVHECRAYLRAVYGHFLGMPSAEASTLADGFAGFGPTLYLRTLREWRELLGLDQGEAIWVLIGTKKYGEGGVPRNIICTAYYKEKA